MMGPARDPALAPNQAPSQDPDQAPDQAPDRAPNQDRDPDLARAGGPDRDSARGGKAAIIGGGVIGAGWVARFLLMGWDVAVYDPAPDAVRRIGEVLDNARRSLPGLYETLLPAEGALTVASALREAVVDADWVQESAPERLETKQTILARIETHCRSEAIIASSTSGFRPSELAENLVTPSRLIVAHPFNPVYLVPLVELVGAKEPVRRARDMLTTLGMRPVHVRHEIDAHIADRLLEAVWREALWLVHDDIATTGEIDDVITYGFGLRWAQMGLFETYRIAGGEAGMRHFMAQFGPALKWPWTKLMEVPALDDALIDKIADQSDAQSGRYSIHTLERLRDDNLVSLLRALKLRDWGAGALLNAHNATLAPKPDTEEVLEHKSPIISLTRVIPVDWVDYNGHMNEARYGQVFSDAADAIMQLIGADAAYIAAGLSFFTVDTHVTYRQECAIGARVFVRSQIIEGRGKKLRLYHEMCLDDHDISPDAVVLATCEQLLIHVSLTTRRSCPPGPAVAGAIEKLAAAHAGLTRPTDERA